MQAKKNPRRDVRTDDLSPIPLESLGVLSVRTDCSEAFCDTDQLVLTFAQRRVLLVLLRQGGRVVRREEVYESAFGRALPRGSRAVDLHVWRIRRALGIRAGAIVSVGRVGYRVDPTRLRA